jgi:DNA polymerase
MLRRTTAAKFIPRSRNLTVLKSAANDCRGCELYQDATQAVFGAGATNATIMLLGEIPGDDEDREGLPFVGPAGWLLDSAMEAAGIDREKIYITNVVKHFRWEPRGKKRLHKKPSARHIQACRPWLEVELEIIRPKVIVLLGSTAAQVFLGRAFRVTAQRGRVLRTDNPAP